MRCWRFITRFITKIDPTCTLCQGHVFKIHKITMFFATAECYHFWGVKNNLGHFKVKICTKLLFLPFFNSNSVLKISSAKNGVHARIFGFTYINLYKLTNFDQFW